MALRTSMTELIALIRLMTNDSAGASALFTDQQIQDVLDQHAYQAEYDQLTPIESIAAGGVVERKKFRARRGFWETNAILTNGNYETLTPSESDYKIGKWGFDTTQSLPVLIYGVWYDTNGAAAEVWDLKAAKFADQFDANIDGVDSTLSQKQAQALIMAKRCRQASVTGSGITRMRRSDVAD